MGRYPGDMERSELRINHLFKSGQREDNPAPIKGPTSGWLCAGGLHPGMVLLLGQHSGHLTVVLTYWVREGRWAGAGSERQDLGLLLRSHLFRAHICPRHPVLLPGMVTCQTSTGWRKQATDSSM